MSHPESEGIESPAQTAFQWRTRSVRIGGLLLFIGSAQFFAVMFVEQALRPGYSDSANTISDLGVDIHGWSYAWMFNSSIVLLGVLGILGLLLLLRVLPRKPLTYSGEGLLFIGILGAISVGLFPETSTALWGKAHDAASIVTFLDANLGMLLLGISLRADRIWGELHLGTTLLGFLATVSLFFYVKDILTNGGFFGLGEGGLERVVAFPVLIWALWIGWFTNRRTSP